VAVAITEEEESDYLLDDYDPIFAEEYDPEYKPKIHENPRVMSCVGSFFIIIVLCITAIVVMITRESIEPLPTYAPTPSPTSSPTSVMDTVTWIR